MKIFFTLINVFITVALFGQFAPPAGEVGTTAIAKDSSAIVNWASTVISFERGLQDITNPDGPLASFGEASEALGAAEGTATDVVSLGDSGVIVLSFPYAIKNGDGADFAIFENSFSNSYLELAHVEVSTDGERWVRFPSISNVPLDEQTGSFGNTDASLIYNLAGKYRGGFGTPFDLEDLVDSVGIDLFEINFVKIIDVVGSIDPDYGTTDSEGNLINDPFKTDFESGGFDLDAVGVINDLNPTSSTTLIEDEPVRIFPNPTNGLVNIQSSYAMTRITVYDLIGNQVGVFDEGSTINFQFLGLNYGTYILVAEFENLPNQITKVNYIN